MDTKLFKYLLLALLLAPPVAAQQVQSCRKNGEIRYEASAAAIVEPWAANIRSFADGQLRIAVVDAKEPPLASRYLLLLFRAGEGEAMAHYCRLVGRGSLGFAAVSLKGMTAQQRQGAGLILRVSTTLYNSETGRFEHVPLEVDIDRAANRVKAFRP